MSATFTVCLLKKTIKTVSKGLQALVWFAEQVWSATISVAEKPTLPAAFVCPPAPPTHDAFRGSWEKYLSAPVRGLQILHLAPFFLIWCGKKNNKKSMNNLLLLLLVNGCQLITPIQHAKPLKPLLRIHFACRNTLWMLEPLSNNGLLSLSLLHSHCAETCHGGSKLVKEEPARQREEIVHEGGDGENQRELFILPTAVCWHIKKERGTL